MKKKRQISYSDFYMICINTLPSLGGGKLFSTPCMWDTWRDFLPMSNVTAEKTVRHGLSHAGGNSTDTNVSFTARPLGEIQ